jgi:hypothetical protein
LGSENNLLRDPRLKDKGDLKMQKRTKMTFMIRGAMLGLSLTTLSPLTGFAQENVKTPKVQKSQGKQQSNKADQTRRAERQREAREAVAKSAAGSLLFDTVTAKEPKWTLQIAHYGHNNSDNDQAVINMFYKKGVDTVNIIIKEYNEAKDAVESFDIPRSYGASVKFDSFGDEGEKVYGENGFIQMTFRKGNFTVTVAHVNEKTLQRDEKTAERFAGYALEAVKNLAAKQ